MADPTPAQIQSVKNTTDAIERGYQALRRCAANIAGLVSLGRATCDDIKAYNIWAIAVFNDQQALLATLRAAGATGIPASISFPTLFAMKVNGQIVHGEDAFKINCNPTTNSLQGALAAAMAPHDSTTIYLGSDQIAAVGDRRPPDEGSGTPSYASLLAAQQQGLGFFPLVLLIGGLAVAVGIFVIGPIFNFLTERKIQEETTARNAQVLDGFAAQTAARLDCFSRCTATGGQSADDCKDLCKKLVGDVPTLATGRQESEKGLSFFSTVGLVGVTIAASYIGFRVLRRRAAAQAYAATHDD